MKLVIDANILFSSIIRDSLTTKLMLDKNLELYAPNFLLDELVKHENLILCKTNRSKEDFSKIIMDLIYLINIVPEADFFDYFYKAKCISPDPDDFQYFALAMNLNCPIWSNDRKLKKQKTVPVYTTKELLNLMNVGKL